MIHNHHLLQIDHTRPPTEWSNDASLNDCCFQAIIVSGFELELWDGQRNTSGPQSIQGWKQFTG